LTTMEMDTAVFYQSNLGGTMKGIEDMPEKAAKERLKTLTSKIRNLGNEAIAIYNEWSPSASDVEKADEAFKNLLDCFKTVTEE